ncbi:MAG: flagellar basal body P-ring formation chaperone FlgA [Rhodomicrobium sp.]
MQKAFLRAAAAIVLLLPQAGAALGGGGSVAYPVLKQMVYPGDIITDDMIAMKREAQLTGFGPVVTDRHMLAGKAARRALLPAQPIPKNAIREPYAILQGRTVTLFFQSGLITITGIATALESGSAGETVNARNTDTGIVIRALVQPDGTLRAQ